MRYVATSGALMAFWGFGQVSYAWNLHVRCAMSDAGFFVSTWPGIAAGVGSVLVAFAINWWTE